MKGISSSVKTKVYELVDDLFDKMSLQLLGQVPSLKNKKSILFTSKPDMTLGWLFLKGLESSKLMPMEVEALKNLLSTAEEYVSSLRSKTKAELVEAVDSYVKESRAKGIAPSSVDVKEKINQVLDKSKNHFKTISEAEATKARNMGRAIQIGKVGASQGIKDPNVFFVVLKDEVTCKHCLSAHLMPDQVTPRVFKLSDIKFGYLSKEEKGKRVSISGQHPRCRCSISFLAENFGFKDGMVAYMGENYDEYKKQRGQQ